jgi:pyruvate/2-oxoglutarate dehydrogenase complex dihydrolipoamide dehydrogenase (E3) component
MYEQFKKFNGIDISKEKMEVGPTAHYSMGVVVVDTKCRTKIGGLFAVGEVIGQIHGVNPKLFTTECKFVGDKILVLMEGNETNEVISAEKILIASGTRPIIPKINGLKESGYITSDEALRISKQPHVTFIGGGYIACELAHFFGSLGTEINIIQRNNLLLPHEDEEISKKFTEIFSNKYNVYLGYNTESVSRDNGNEFHVIARNLDGR